ncbi:hypothetical protein OAH77_04460 [Flavobacteriaceae bacterium]|nr:hypothetical protein [Flavobacteriaceae bacterium]
MQTNQTITTALLKYENEKYNHCEVVPQTVDKDHFYDHRIDKEQYLQDLTYQKCIRIRFDNVETIEKPTQEEIKKIYKDWVKCFARRNIKVHCSNIVAQATFLKHCYGDCKTLSVKRTEQYVKDVDGLQHLVFDYKGNKFISIRFENTWLISKFKHKVIGKNDGQYGRNRPSSKVEDTFYNKDGQLIFYINDKQKENLQRELDGYEEQKKASDYWDKNKGQISETNWVPLMDWFAIFLLECVPPNGMKRNEHLCGDPVNINSNGETLYYHCKKVCNTEPMWRVKLSTVKEFENK